MQEFIRAWPQEITMCLDEIGMEDNNSGMNHAKKSRTHS
jgi:hypothetical protein